ncbi:thiol peroxidase [Arenicella xantha]|uniref:Thiol peroxidase n=1 Tax=Arenicella xantha TaxID=644221 RepID=A0A395JIP1_9GAMM|nr:thiol peroxidase [Arenicella xantha]RBP49639.1 thiol peroxidase (atypical 2-Cys peroxiredoxin) [Arenicella xantha]
MQVTLKGNPINLTGTFPTVGSNAADFKLTTSGLADVGLAEYAGKKKVVSIVPSLDTAVCATSTQKFNAQVADKEGVQLLVVSGDLPFAAGRFCEANSAGNTVTLSTMRNNSFATDYGVLMADGPLAGLTARAVLVLDENNTVLHAELVPEITQEPDYEAALAAL